MKMVVSRYLFSVVERLIPELARGDIKELLANLGAVDTIVLVGAEN
jgi:hypothetical protein